MEIGKLKLNILFDTDSVDLFIVESVDLNCMRKSYRLIEEKKDDKVYYHVYFAQWDPVSNYEGVESIFHSFSLEEAKNYMLRKWLQKEDLKAVS